MRQTAKWLMGRTVAYSFEAPPRLGKARQRTVVDPVYDCNSRFDEPSVVWKLLVALPRPQRLLQLRTHGVYHDATSKLHSLVERLLTQGR